MEPIYCFVDAGYLNKHFREILARHQLPLDYTINIPRLTGAHKVFYYDAFPVKKHSQSDEDYQIEKDNFEALIKKIGSKSGFHIKTGYTRFRRKKLEQKGVDILLTVDALQHATRGNVKNINIFSGDLDFAPLIEALISTGCDVSVSAFERSCSDELVQVADSFQFYENHEIISSIFEANYQEFVRMNYFDAKKSFPPNEMDFGTCGQFEFFLIEQGPISSIYTNENKVYSFAEQKIALAFIKEYIYLKFEEELNYPK